MEGSSPLHRKVSPDPNNRNGDLKEGMSENSAFQEVDPPFCVRGNSINEADDVVRPDKRRDNNGKNGSGAARGFIEIERETQNVETSGSDSSSTRGKNCIDQLDSVEFQKSSEQVDESGLGGVQQGEKVQTIQCEEKQRRKRKRTIMNDNQVALMEKALLDEPDMQRHASSVRFWAEKLSEHVCTECFLKLLFMVIYLHLSFYNDKMFLTSSEISLPGFGGYAIPAEKLVRCLNLGIGCACALGFNFFFF